MRKIDATKLSDRALARVVILDALITYLVTNAQDRLETPPVTRIINHLNNMLDAARFVFRSRKAEYAFDERIDDASFGIALEAELAAITNEQRTAYREALAHGHEEQRCERTRQTAQRAQPVRAKCGCRSDGTRCNAHDTGSRREHYDYNQR